MIRFLFICVYIKILQLFATTVEDYIRIELLYEEAQKYLDK